MQACQWDKVPSGHGVCYGSRRPTASRALQGRAGLKFVEAPHKALPSPVPPGGLSHFMRLEVATANADAVAHGDAERLGVCFAGRDAR